MFFLSFDLGLLLLYLLTPKSFTTDTWCGSPVVVKERPIVGDRLIAVTSLDAVRVRNKLFMVASHFETSCIRKYSIIPAKNLCEQNIA